MSTPPAPSLARLRKYLDTPVARPGWPEGDGLGAFTPAAAAMRLYAGLGMVEVGWDG